ncbi:MAG: O-antigen ligase family protein [Dehalococcoidia bacterium]|nr:O-antigen ligase family protein [Dehalococcoidia bacterium]
MQDSLLGRLRVGVDHNPLARRGLLALACVVFGLIGGVVTAAISPLAGFAAIAGLGVVAAILVNPLVGVLAFVGVAYLLPFAVVPAPIGGVKLSFIDVALTLCLAVWVIRLLIKPEEKLIGSPLDLLIALFLGMAMASFLIGVSSVTAEVTRFFLKTINSILFFFSVINCVRTRRQLVMVISALLVVGFTAAVLGILFYGLRPTLTVQILSLLRPLGYPTGMGLLRYIAGTDTMRAIGTSIDPNILGGMLTLAIPLTVAQLFGGAPLVSRRYIVTGLVAMVICLGLTISRSSWLGAAAGVLFIGTLKYRRLWVVFGLFLVVLYFIPQGDFVVERLQSAATFEDQSAAMRLGEYKDALRLISQYPWLGVGFGSAPSIDEYVAASSVYLLMAEEMGLLGLGVFLVTVVVAFRYALLNSKKITDPRLQAIQVGAMGGTVGALVAGLFDHYYFNLNFPHTVAIFWLFIGIVVVSTRIGLVAPENG